MPTAQENEIREKKGRKKRAPKRHTRRTIDTPILEVIRRWPKSRQTKRYPIGLMKTIQRKKVRRHR